MVAKLDYRAELKKINELEKSRGGTFPGPKRLKPEPSPGEKGYYKGLLVEIEEHEERIRQNNIKLKLDTTTGLQDTGKRVELGFAMNDEKELESLKRGYDAERLDDGRLIYMNEKTGRPTTVEEDSLKLHDLADWVGDAPELVGSMVGGVVGYAIGGPKLAIPFAGWGGMRGKHAKKVLGKMLYDNNEFTGNNAVEDLAITFGINAADEVGSAGLAKILRPFANKIKPKTLEGIRNFAEYKGKLSPKQAVNHWMVSVMENVAEASLWGGETVAKFREEADASLISWGKQLGLDFGHALPREYAGKLYQGVLNKNSRWFKAAAKPLFKNVDVLTEKVRVNMSGVSDSALTLQGEMQTSGFTLKKLRRASGGRQTEGLLDEMIHDLPKVISFSDAQKLRSDWFELSKAPVTLVPNNVSRAAKIMVAKVDNAMMKASEGLTKEGGEAFRKATKFWKDGKSKFNDDFITRVGGK